MCFQCNLYKYSVTCTRGSAVRREEKCPAIKSPPLGIEPITHRVPAPTVKRIQCIPHFIIQSAKHCRSQHSRAGLYTSADLYTPKAGVSYADQAVEKGKDRTTFHAHKPPQMYEGCRIKHDNLQFGERYYLAFFKSRPDCLELCGPRYNQRACPNCLVVV